MSINQVMTGVSFSLPRSNCIPAGFENKIHGEWIDHVPRKLQVDFGEDYLRIDHSFRETLRIVVPWEVSGLGLFFLKTVSLPHSEKPYDLIFELARGTVGRLVDQIENWKVAGLVLDSSSAVELKRITQDFQAATFAKLKSRAGLCEAIIENSIHLMTKTGAQFALHVFDLRKREKHRNTALLACPLDPNLNATTIFDTVFNTFLVPVETTETETKKLEGIVKRFHKKGISTCSSPFLDFRDPRSNDYVEIDDAKNEIVNQAFQYVERSLIPPKLSYAISGLGVTNETCWNDQEQIHLCFELLSKLKRNQPNVPLIVGIDQPFGEGQLNNSMRRNPKQIADNLIRMDAPVSAFSLEINLGYYPNGSWTRDLFAFNDLIDGWSQFEYPLILNFRIPSGLPVHQDSFLGVSDPEKQAEWLYQMAVLGLAKHNVAGVFYGELFDQADSQFAEAGLLNRDFEAKPVLQKFRQLRSELE